MRCRSVTCKHLCAHTIGAWTAVHAIRCAFVAACLIAVGLCVPGAAMLRAFHGLLLGGSHQISELAKAALREPAVFHGVRLVCAQVGGAVWVRWSPVLQT